MVGAKAKVIPLLVLTVQFQLADYLGSTSTEEFP